MALRSPDEKAVPRSRGEKSLVSQFEIVADAFLESFELLEEYAPIWYAEQHHKSALLRGESCKSPSRLGEHSGRNVTGSLTKIISCCSLISGF